MMRGRTSRKAFGFRTGTSRRDDALVARLAHGGSLFAARFARHVLQRARKHDVIFVMVLIIALDYDSVSTGRTLLAVLGFDDPRSSVEERHIKKYKSRK
jgi:hypothetical protein